MSRKNNGTSETNGRIEKTIAKPADDVPFQPVYFLSLEVENFRCFGPKQTLNLATEDGRPAQWTVILGENGVGKTTLLKAFANLQPVVPKSLNDFDEQYHTIPQIFDSFAYSNSTDLRQIFDMYRSIGGGVKIKATYHIGHLLDQKSKSDEHFMLSVGFQSSGGSCASGDIKLKNMVCYGYAASRRMGKSIYQKSEKAMIAPVSFPMTPSYSMSKNGFCKQTTPQLVSRHIKDRP